MSHHRTGLGFTITKTLDGYVGHLLSVKEVDGKLTLKTKLYKAESFYEAAIYYAGHLGYNEPCSNIVSATSGTKQRTYIALDVKSY